MNRTENEAGRPTFQMTSVIVVGTLGPLYMIGLLSYVLSVFSRTRVAPTIFEHTGGPPLIGQVFYSLVGWYHACVVGLTLVGAYFVLYGRVTWRDIILYVGGAVNLATAWCCFMALALHVTHTIGTLEWLLRNS